MLLSNAMRCIKCCCGRFRSLSTAPQLYGASLTSPADGSTGVAVPLEPAETILLHVDVSEPWLLQTTPASVRMLPETGGPQENWSSPRVSQAPNVQNSTSFNVLCREGITREEPLAIDTQNDAPFIESAEETEEKNRTPDSSSGDESN